MMDDAISRQAAIRLVKIECNPYGKPTIDFESGKKFIEHLKQMPAAKPDVIRCKDCKHQEKFFHADRRRKGGGYYIYGCELAEGYSHVCLDDDFCSKAERRTDG